MRRVRILVRRFIAASKLGFVFLGTNKTRFPSLVSLCGRRIRLNVPEHSGHVNDLINVWLDDEYGLKAVPKFPRTVLDVGANVGLFSLWAAHNFPGTNIHAYEPNPQVLPCLENNLRGSDIRMFAEGLGVKSGKGRMTAIGDSRLASLELSQEGEIRIETLPRAIERLGGFVDIMKLDCEGAEWKLLQDVEWHSRVSEIRMEYHLVDGYSLEDLKRLTKDSGFRLQKLIPNRGFGIAWLGREKR